MSKAEDRYFDYFLDGRLRNCSSQKAFIYGYHQAEKDLELTWEDIKKLDRLISTKRINDGLFDKEDYEEVLNRFKNLKK